MVKPYAIGSLPARGVWIEIANMVICLVGSSGHSPRGECGLKYHIDFRNVKVTLSLPARGVWIEIDSVIARLKNRALSLPARGVWIEIDNIFDVINRDSVTPREGSVD